jgi:hypothetical protein
MSQNMGKVQYSKNGYMDSTTGLSATPKLCDNSCVPVFSEW